MDIKSVGGLVLLAIGLANGPGAWALDLRLDGFGSLAVGRAVASAPLPDGAESSYLVVPTFAKTSAGRVNPDAAYDDAWTWQPDTNAALQLSVLFTSDFSATLQLTAHGANDLNPEIEWANLTYDVSANFGVKLGRQRIPLYFYSDYLDLGYAYHWLRPPPDVYGEGVSTYTGASLTYRGQLRGWGTRLDAYYGDVANDTAFSWRARDEDMLGVVLKDRKSNRL